MTLPRLQHRLSTELSYFKISNSSKMATKMLEIVAEQLPLVASTLIVLLALLAQRFLAKSAISSLPLAGAAIGNAEKRRKAYLKGAKTIYAEGYQKASSSSSLA